jgi:uncharacterized RDD family membrane protein YckC
MQTIKITTSQNIDIDYQLAGLGDRILARLIDYAVFVGLYLAVLIILGVIGGFIDYYNGSGKNVGIYILIGAWFLLCVLYDLISEIFFNGQSIGKRAMNIKVISLTGARPRVGQYLLRWMFRIIDFGITGGSAAIIAVALTDKKQRIGDIVADTTVVNLSPKSSINELAMAPPSAGYVPQFTQVTLLTDSDIVLIHEVIKNYVVTRNKMLVYKLAMKLRSYLNVSYPSEINDYQFLKIVVDDYNCLAAKGES